MEKNAFLLKNSLTKLTKFERSKIEQNASKDFPIYRLKSSKKYPKIRKSCQKNSQFADLNYQNRRKKDIFSEIKHELKKSGIHR